MIICSPRHLTGCVPSFVELNDTLDVASSTRQPLRVDAGAPRRAPHRHEKEKHPLSGRGLQSSTFQLNVSTFYGIGGALRGCFRGNLRGIQVVSGVNRWDVGYTFLSETAQLELQTGRV
jgi:hypothetical protein